MVAVSSMTLTRIMVVSSALSLSTRSITNAFSLHSKKTFKVLPRSSLILQRHGHAQTVVRYLSKRKNTDDPSPLSSSPDDDDDDTFRPSFDGQLYYGLEADDDGMVQTTMSDLQRIHLNRKVSYGTTLNDDDDDDTDETSRSKQQRQQQHDVPILRERAIIGKIPIISRIIPIPLPSSSTITITIWEMEDPSPLVQRWMSAPTPTKDTLRDPFGVVMWPGAILAAQELSSLDLVGRTVVVLGAGTGVEAQAAAMFGADKVWALDVNEMTLRLLTYGAERAGWGDVIEGRVFDLFSGGRIPRCDVLVAADVLYNEQLAMAVAGRVGECLEMDPRPRVIVTDSQKFHGTDFLKSVRVRGEPVELRWEERHLRNVTGSGILIQGDQTYDVKARLLNVPPK